MNDLSLHATLLFAFFPFSLITHAQTTPNYRLRTLEYEKKYEGNTQEYQKNSYTYYSDRNSILDFTELESVIASPYQAIQGLKYDLQTTESTGRPVPSKYEIYQGFDNNGRIFTHLTSKLYNNDSYYDSIRYNSHGNILSYYHGKGNNLDLLTNYYYDANNRLDSFSDYYVQLNKYYSHMHYTYNTLTGVLENTFYTYSIPGPYNIETAEYYSYDNKGRVLQVKYLQSTIAYPIDTFSETTYEYNDSGDVAKKTIRRWDVQQAAYTFSTITFYTYNPKRKLLQKLNMSGDGNALLKDTLDITGYSYDAFDLPYLAEKKIWGTKIFPQVGIYDSVYKVRTIEKIIAMYELFWPSGVNEQAANIPTLIIYPNPASTAINIVANFTKPQAFTMYVIDVFGRRLRKWEVSVTSTYNNTFQLQDVPAGNYFLSLEGTSEKISRQFTLR